MPKIPNKSIPNQNYGKTAANSAVKLEAFNILEWSNPVNLKSIRILSVGRMPA
jgi:hypothetical protein